MLTSSYVRNKEKFSDYTKLSYDEQNDIQFTEQTRVRKELTRLFVNIYNIIKQILNTDKENIYSKDEIIGYILNNGFNNGFKYVSTIETPIGSRYYGTEIELKLSSLLYERPILTITGIQNISAYELSYWETYNINVESLNKGIELSKSLGLRPVCIIPVDLFGQPADYDSIAVIAKEHNLWVMADGAQAFGAYYKNRKHGAYSDEDAQVCVALQRQKCLLGSVTGGGQAVGAQAHPGEKCYQGKLVEYPGILMVLRLSQD